MPENVSMLYRSTRLDASYPLGGAGKRPFRLGPNQRQVKNAHFPGFASLCQRPATQAGKAFFDVRFSSLRSEKLHPVGRVGRVKKSFARLLHKSVDWGKCGAPPPTTDARWGSLKMTLPHHFSRCRLPGGAFALDALTKQSCLWHS